MLLREIAVHLRFWLFTVLAVPATVAAQMGMGYGMGPHSPMGAGMMGGSPVRRAYVMREGIDARYADMTDPNSGSAREVDEGRELYKADCAACHGDQGLGDGPAGKSLNPPPAPLIGVGRMPIATDGYRYWTIAEGGAPVGSAMPAFKAVLKPQQIWSLVAYLRSR